MGIIKYFPIGTIISFLLWSSIACAPAALPTSAAPPANPGQADLKVVAVETFLADIAQNVAGDRVQVQSLIPLGQDPHSFEPTPQDIIRVAASDVLIANGAGFEAFLDKLLQNAGGERVVIAASDGLAARQTRAGEPIGIEPDSGGAHPAIESVNAGDPHFWLDPINVIRYAENIRDGLTQADPAGAEIYKSNAAAYIEKLKILDAKIKTQVETIPAPNRKLVTEHDTFGYYADRYGFEIIGMLIPSSTSADASSAQQLAQLIDRIKSTGTRAIFLDAGTNPQLAEQVARDANVRVVTDLNTHSLSASDGPAPTYLQMLEYDTSRIVDALR
jgi:ABC-type Zn uptake system ZnuABC Zn-binding protein ZnuA